MKPEEFLTYAQRIAATPGLSAAEYRSAVSRAYYGVYLQTRDWLKSLGIVIKGGNEHKLMRVYLTESKVAIAVELARLLDNLQTSRKDADYSMETLAMKHRRHPTGRCSAPPRFKKSCGSAYRSPATSSLEYWTTGERPISNSPQTISPPARGAFPRWRRWVVQGQFSCGDRDAIVDGRFRPGPNPCRWRELRWRRRQVSRRTRRFPQSALSGR